MSCEARDCTRKGRRWCRVCYRRLCDACYRSRYYVRQRRRSICGACLARCEAEGTTPEPQRWLFILPGEGRAVTCRFLPFALGGRAPGIVKPPETVRTIVIPESLELEGWEIINLEEDEMTTSRRGFLGTCATALAGLAMVRLPERWTLPVLYGDGVHDDTAALQALIDGERAWDADEGRVLHYPHKPCMLPPGSYCFTTLNIGPGQRIDFGRAPVALHSPTWWGNAL